MGVRLSGWYTVVSSCQSVKCTVCDGAIQQDSGAPIVVLIQDGPSAVRDD